MTSLRQRLLWAACAAFSTHLAACQAQTGPAGQGPRPPGPPPEAVQACQGKRAGDTASFSNREGQTLTGQCQLIDGVLAIPPQHQPGQGAGRPPSSML